MSSCPSYLPYLQELPRGLEICPLSPLQEEFQDPGLFQTVQKMLLQIIPPYLLEELYEHSRHLSLDDPTFHNSLWYYRLIQSLPLFLHLAPSTTPGNLSILYLCQQTPYTRGIQRYILDTLNQWLMPEKPLSFSAHQSLAFQFRCCKYYQFYIAHEQVGVENIEELQAMQSHLPQLIEEMKMNILAVSHARHIASLKSISLDRKKTIIQENLRSILNIKTQEWDENLFDHMQTFLLRLSAEKKMGDVKKKIASLRALRPKAFERDVFYEMTYFTLLFRDHFSSKRQSQYIGRIIALHYLFKKALQNSLEKEPLERHLALKISQTRLTSSRPILGVLIGMTLVKDAERLEKRQVLEAVRSILPNATLIKDSFIADRREEKVRFFYLEIGKPLSSHYDRSEIKQLREKLPEEIKKQIERAFHPIFMPRNEEDLLRNLVNVCKQLKYAHDLPQVSIHYEKQTLSELTFTILMARLKKQQEPSLKVILNNPSPLTLAIDDLRSIGMVGKKHLKEAAMVRATLNKSPFFRQDHSVDLLRARQKVVLELTKLLGDFRDFNGGMILKQDEAFESLRRTLIPLSPEKEFLLENYFYSLRPSVMQTVLDTDVLIAHFRLLSELIEEELLQQAYQIKKEQKGNFHLFFISALGPSFKDPLESALEGLKIPSHNLTSSFLQIQDLSTFGLILRTDTPSQKELLEEKLIATLDLWSKRFLCLVPGKQMLPTG